MRPRAAAVVLAPWLLATSATWLPAQAVTGRVQAAAAPVPGDLVSAPLRLTLSPGQIVRADLRAP